jgi:hypothetical protein
MIHRLRSLAQRLATLLAAILLVATALLRTSCAQEAPALSATVDRKQVYEGESIIYQLSALNVADPTVPDLSEFTDFQVKKIDEQSRNQQIVQIFNGRRTEIRRLRHIYVYELTPLKSGQLTIPPARMKLSDGTTLEGNPVAIQVAGVAPQDNVILEASADREHYYLSQPITITLSVLVRALPGDNSEINPLQIFARRRFDRASALEPPQLTIPWLNDDSFPSQLLAKESMSELLTNWYNESGAGFIVNGVGRDRLGSLLRLSPLLQNNTVFQPPPTKVTRTDAQGASQTYWRYDFTRTFIGQDIGAFELGACNVKGAFVGVDSQGQPYRQLLYAISQPIQFEVVDAPLAGRPTNYTGAIGQFTATSRLSSQTAHVGDPIELQIEFRGEGTLNRIRPPDLSTYAEIAKNFRFHEPTERTSGDRHTITYNVRPLTTSIQEFPSLEFSYFDTQREEYVALKTAAIPLKVSPSNRLTQDQIVGADAIADSATNSEEGEGTLEDNEDGDAIPKTLSLINVSSLKSDGLNWQVWIAAWSSISIVYVTATTWILRHRQVDHAKSPRRIKPAIQQGKATMQRATQLAEAGNVREADRQLRIAITEIIVAARGSGMAASMTLHDLQTQVGALSLGSEFQDQLARWWNAYEEAQYGGQAVPADHVSQGQRLLEHIIARLS